MAGYPKPSTSKAPELQAVPSTLTGSSIGSANSAGTIYHPTFHFRWDYNSASTNSDLNSNPNPLSPRGYSSPLVFEKLRKDEMQSTGSSSTSADHANSAGSLPSPPLIREGCPLHALYNDDRELPLDGEDESGRATGVEKSKDAHERQKPESHGLRYVPKSLFKWNFAKFVPGFYPGSPDEPTRIHQIKVFQSFQHRWMPDTLQGLYATRSCAEERAEALLIRKKPSTHRLIITTAYPVRTREQKFLPQTISNANLPNMTTWSLPIQTLHCKQQKACDVCRHRWRKYCATEKRLSSPNKKQIIFYDGSQRRVGSSSQHKTVLVNEEYLKSERIREIVTIFKTFGLTCLGSAIVTPELEEYTDQVGFDGVVFFLINTDGRKPQDIPLSEHLAPLTIFHSPTGKFHLFGQQDIEADLGSDLNGQAISQILTASCWL